jgi:hypothetical protein
LSSLLNSTFISNVSIDDFSTGKVSLSGHPALRVIYSGMARQTQTEVKIPDERAIIDSKNYAVYFSADANRYDRLIPVAEDIINSFRVTG